MSNDAWEPYSLTIPHVDPSQRCDVYIIDKVVAGDGGYSVSGDGLGAFIPKLADDQPEPKPGDMVELFSKGLGYYIDGIRLNGRVIFYRDAEQSEQHARRQRENAGARMRRDREAFLARRDEALRSLQPITTAPGKEARWQEFVETNSTDPYSFGVVQFAARWAHLMEAMWLDKQVASVCESARKLTAHDVTGYMYGCAVSILAEVWIHGEALRRWHNRDTQLGTEGDRANESGGVLNPALLGVGG